MTERKANKAKDTPKGEFDSGNLRSTMDRNFLSEPYPHAIGGARTKRKPRLDEMDKERQ